jgi:hypothetical protein
MAAALTASDQKMSLTMKVRKVVPADLSYNDGKEISFKGVDGTTWTEGCAPQLKSEDIVLRDITKERK